jgi:hypothetical protein
MKNKNRHEQPTVNKPKAEMPFEPPYKDKGAQKSMKDITRSKKDDAKTDLKQD